MLSRRALFAGGAVMIAGGARAGAAGQRNCEDYSDELRSIQGTLGALTNKVSTPTVAELRDRQRIFLRMNQRFPQYIPVGIRVWERMQDWHISNQRPLTIQRSGEGEWQMDFIMSILVLKLEYKDDEIGPAYER